MFYLMTVNQFHLTFGCITNQYIFPSNFFFVFDDSYHDWNIAFAVFFIGRKMWQQIYSEYHLPDMTGGIALFELFVPVWISILLNYQMTCMSSYKYIKSSLKSTKVGDIFNCCADTTWAVHYLHSNNTSKNHSGIFLFQIQYLVIYCDWHMVMIAYRWDGIKLVWNF